MKTRKNWLAPAIFAGLVVSLSVTLLTIGARSPFTHLNLSPGVISSYDRTTQTLVGPPQAVQTDGMAALAARHSDLTQRGAVLFMGLSCAACHGLRGEGSIVGPVIAGSDAGTLATFTTKGPKGMPVFAGLTGEDLQALAAYLHPDTKTPGSN